MVNILSIIILSIKTILLLVHFFGMFTWTLESPSEVIEHLKQNLIKHSNFNPSPNYYGYITGGGNQIGILAEFIKSALNQNNLKWHSAPASCFHF